MLKVKMIPVLSRIISKLDLKPVINTVRGADIFENTDTKEAALKQLNKEKAAELTFEILSDITPQLDKVGNDIPELISLYYGISREEADEKDFAEVLNDLINDEGIRAFFKTALRKKAERDA